MSKFSNGPLTDFNGPCKRDPVTPVVIDPATVRELTSIAINIINQMVPLGVLYMWQVRPEDLTKAATGKAILQGWHLANGAAIESLSHEDGTALTAGEVAALKALYPTKCHYAKADDPGVQPEDLVDTWRIPSMDTGLVHTYNVFTAPAEILTEVYSKEQIDESFYTKTQADAKFEPKQE
jgi:hypothetical protein